MVFMVLVLMKIKMIFLILGKIVDDNEYLYLPIPITKTDDWYNRLKQFNNSRL